MQTASQIAQRPGVRFPALRNGLFRLYMGTSALDMLSDNIEHVLTYWVLYELTRSPFWLGYAVFSHWIPFALLSVHAGYLADRYDKRLIQQIGAGLLTCTSLGLGIMVVSDTVNLWIVAPLLLLHGLAGVLSNPSTQVFMNRIVGPQDLMSAMAIHASTRHAAQFLGPAIAGAMLLLIGPGVAYLLNALLHLPYLVALAFCPSYTDRSRPAPGGSWGAIGEGLGYLLRNPTLLVITLVTAAPGLLVGTTYQALMPIFAEYYAPEGGPARTWVYAALLSGPGLGAILGGIGVSSTGSLPWRGRLLIATGISSGAMLVLFAGSSALWLALAALFGLGMGSVVFTSVSQTVVQTETPERLQGRVVGAYATATHGSRAFSGVLVGGLATVIGSAWALGLGGLAVVVCVAAAAASRGLRELD